MSFIAWVLSFRYAPLGTEYSSPLVEGISLFAVWKHLACSLSSVTYMYFVGSNIYIKLLFFLFIYFTFCFSLTLQKNIK